MRWLTVLAWGGVIWWLLTLPPDDVPEVPSIPLGDKLGHIAVFCIWGFLICWATDKSFRALSKAGVGLVSVLAVSAYGIAAEFSQAAVGRDAELLDVLADIAGAVFAMYLYFSPRPRAILRRVFGKRAFASGELGAPALSFQGKPASEKELESAGEGEGER